MAYCEQIENVPDASYKVHRYETSCKAINEIPAAVQLLLQKIRTRAIGKAAENMHRFDTKTLLKIKIRYQHLIQLLQEEKLSGNDTQGFLMQV
jgi:hypothetical protein